MKRWVFVDSTTGLMDGTVLICDDAAADLNTPPGHDKMEFDGDPTRHQVDLLTGDVLELAPQPPPLADRQASLVRELDAALRAAELGQARPTRDVALAMAAGNPVPADALERLQAVENRCALLRTLRAEALAATNHTELDAVAWPPAEEEP